MATRTPHAATQARSILKLLDRVGPGRVTTVGDLAAQPKLIFTEPGVGYQLADR